MNTETMAVTDEDKIERIEQYLNELSEADKTLGVNLLRTSEETEMLEDKAIENKKKHSLLERKLNYVIQAIIHDLQTKTHSIIEDTVLKQRVFVLKQTIDKSEQRFRDVMSKFTYAMCEFRQLRGLKVGEYSSLVIDRRSS